MIRKARIKDVNEIYELISYHAQEGKMLPRSLNDLYEYLRDFHVFEIEGEIIGVCGLHINWEDLAEIRSLAVRKGRERQGVGTALAKECIEEARQLDLLRLYTLTYKPRFFERLGFQQMNKSELPHKVWRDCLQCSKFPDCDEIALILELKEGV